MKHSLSGQMFAVWILCCFVFLNALGAEPPSSETLAEKLLAGLKEIKSVSVSVRKDSSMAGVKAPTLLSKVYFVAPDKLYVENASPFKRQIVSDGSFFYMAHAGFDKVLKMPISKLDGEWKIMQDSIPASPMEHLLRLKGFNERVLPDEGDCICRAYDVKTNLFVVLFCNKEWQLNKITYYNDQKLTDEKACYEFSQFVRVKDDVWLATLHKARGHFRDGEYTETKRFDNMLINTEISPAIFDAEHYFKGRPFVNSTEELFGELEKTVAK
jgi:outer membrane lipoprotein-sorting protein